MRATRLHDVCRFYQMHVMGQGFVRLLVDKTWRINDHGICRANVFGPWAAVVYGCAGLLASRCAGCRESTGKEE